MSNKKFKIPQAKCLRCGHEWTPRREVVTICPSCKSPYWNTPKREVNPEKLVDKSIEKQS